MVKETRRPLASRLNDLVALLSPSLAERRERALASRGLIMSFGHYEGAGRSGRGRDFRVNRTDAVEAGRASRERLSWISRDMLRNNPRVVKAQMMIVGQAVGRGVVPRVSMTDPEDIETRARIETLIRQHCLRRDVDADGRLNLYGLQALAMAEICAGGEVLIRRRLRRAGDGLSLPFQIQVMEGDFLNADIDGQLSNGNRAVEGVEFDVIGRRVAYHMFAEHPGGRAGPLRQTRRIEAANVIHAFDQKRPGQVRGISWFAPVITLLHELQKYQDGQVKRQEIAALFAGIYKSDASSEELDEELGQLKAGAMLKIGSDESMDFTDPPAVEGYEPFMRGTDRTLAAGMGLTYEGFSGDYSGVNFSSARMGRLDTDPTVERWQNHIVITQVCEPFTGWLKEAIADVEDIDPASYEITWTAPRRPMIDPTKEYVAQERAVQAGFKSRRSIIRENGYDPSDVEREIADERAAAKANGVSFTTDDTFPARQAEAPNGQIEEDSENE